MTGRAALELFGTDFNCRREQIGRIYLIYLKGENCNE
jgi:hypothetical protein